MREGVESQSIYPEREDRPQGLIEAAWRGGRWKPDGTDVFCNRREARPEVLLETPNLLVIPDLFPLTPGHVLIIPKRHYPCFGGTPARGDAEVEAVVRQVRAFLRDTYGLEAMLWENGGPASGQSVHHAHLHLIPLPAGHPVPAAQDALAIPGKGLAPIRTWWHSHKGGRAYHLMEVGNDRRLLPGGSPDVRQLNLYKAAVLHIPTTLDGERWVRKTNPVEVARTVMLWQRWALSHPLKQFRGPGSGLEEVA